MASVVACIRQDWPPSGADQQHAFKDHAEAKPGLWPLGVKIRSPVNSFPLLLSAHPTPAPILDPYPPWSVDAPIDRRRTRLSVYSPPPPPPTPTPVISAATDLLFLSYHLLNRQSRPPAALHQVGLGRHNPRPKWLLPAAVQVSPTRSTAAVCKMWMPKQRAILGSFNCREASTSTPCRAAQNLGCPLSQGWQWRWGALTSAPRPAPPGKISAPRPAPPSAPGLARASPPPVDPLTYFAQG